MNTKLEANLVGVAGEYLVAGELTLRGLIASISLRNSRGIDIIVSDSEGENSRTIQVKANSSGKSKWLLSKKSQDFYSESHFYGFVALNPLGARARFHVVPSEVVARQIKSSHEFWLSEKKRDGNDRKDTNKEKGSEPNYFAMEEEKGSEPNYFVVEV